MISVIHHFAPCLNIYGQDLGQGKGGDRGGCKGRGDIRLSLMSLQMSHFSTLRLILQGLMSLTRLKRTLWKYS